MTFVFDDHAAMAAYLEVIRTRFASDFRATYRRPPARADRTFLLLGRMSEADLVSVIPVKSLAGDGAYEALDGLTYEFEPGTRRLLNVLSDRY